MSPLVPFYCKILIKYIPLIKKTAAYADETTSNHKKRTTVNMVNAAIGVWVHHVNGQQRLLLPDGKNIHVLQLFGKSDNSDSGSWINQIYVLLNFFEICKLFI